MEPWPGGAPGNQRPWQRVRGCHSKCSDPAASVCNGTARREGMGTHSEHVLQQLCSQLEYGFLCDCSIAVGDVRFRAHRVVLAACSSYFHKLFVNQPADSSLVSLSTQAVSPDHFDLILQLMYTGRLDSSPADPERFRASLRFLKLYNAGRFQGDREAEEGPPPATGKPLVFGVQLYQERAGGGGGGEGQEPAAYPQASVSVKAESPEEASDPQAYLCHHCGLAFEEQRGLREHLRLHAERPLHCPLCCLAFERAQGLQEHLGSCLGRPSRPDPAVKREDEAERPGPDGRPREGGNVKAEVGGGGRRPWAPEGEAEDYELEEGEVRFPGDDDLVLENATDDSFSSSESSLEGDGDGSARTEPSEDEGGAGGPSGSSAGAASSSAANQALAPGLGRASCQAARRKGKAWRCRACEGCCPAEERSWSRKKKKRRRRRSEEGEEPASSSSPSPGLLLRLQQEAERPWPASKLAAGPGAGEAAALSERLACPAYARAFPRELRLQLAGRPEGGGTRFECAVCGHRSRRKHPHLRHLASHLAPGQAVCQVCFEILGSKAELQRHLESHLYSCGVCGEKFRLKKDMVAHANSCWARKLHGGEAGRFGPKSKD
ncbi:zinc finger and BTB domain-containing protein 1-like [Pristis pectinata]|uniref:zinc finger and BTB domain-containing protein 1-like n=1 Tax=Pristis pectinata TaxID=685728 RepID=UPI00223E3D98|nr:zinc finger and BTB domain-containing protein 1-like [Pristis pectinata]